MLFTADEDHAPRCGELIGELIGPDVGNVPGTPAETTAAPGGAGPDEMRRS